MSRTLALLTLVGLLPLTACGSRSAPRTQENGRSRLAGRVLAFPACAAQAEPAEASGTASPPCQARPVVARLRVVDAPTGRVVALLRSDPDGRFGVRLAPGNYEVQALLEDGSGAGSRQHAVLRPGEVTEVVVEFDTGAR